MEEIWKPVIEFPSHYCVSDNGNVKRTKKGSGAVLGKNLKPGKDAGGYCKVVLSIEGIKHNRNVHNLVAEAFLGPRPEGQLVRHLDGNKRNNTLDNLAYGTGSQNVADSIKHGTCAFGDKHPSSKLTEKEVECIIQEKGRHKDIALKYGVSRQLVGLIKLGKRRNMRNNNGTSHP